MKDSRAKICRGNFSEIDRAIEEGIINKNDIVITKDTCKFVYILEDGTKQIIGDDDIVQVDELPANPISDKIYLLKPDKLYTYDSGWIRLNEKSEKPEALSNADIEEILKNL